MSEVATIKTSSGNNGRPPLQPEGAQGPALRETLQEFFNEFNRLKSFPIIWTGQFSKGRLAKDGFYYAGHGLCSICIFCDFQLEDFRTGNIPDDVHQSNSPGCSLVNGTENRNVPLGDVTNYRLEKHRLISFLVTSWTAPVDPYDLAKWGFYWTGTADVGRCTFCRLEVRGWEEGDRGRSEHERWNPQCAFIQRRSVGNVPLGEEDAMYNLVVWGSGGPYSTVTRRHEPAEYLHYTGPHTMTAEELGVTVTTPARHPQYQSVESRRASYATWPISLPQRPPELSEAGFYYTGQGDRIICFQCGGGLKDWGVQDNPWVEHAVWFSQCPYLLLKKGRDFVTNAAAMKEALQSMHPNEPSSTPTVEQPSVIFPAVTTLQVPTAEMGAVSLAEPMEASNENNENISEDHRGANRDAYGLDRCQICHERELGVVNLPCGHMASCVDCAPQTSECPICHAKVNAYVRAFLP